MSNPHRAPRRPLRLIRAVEPEAIDLSARGIEGLIEDAVERAVLRALAPHLRKLSSPEPATYTVGQAAAVLQVSNDTVSRLVKRGVLTKVPHLDGKTLIPRQAVAALLGTAPDRKRPGRPATRRKP